MSALNPALLLRHFDRISEAPDAIPRLRRFILDLAVRGKLVEQDPNDEPASELMRLIEKERARLVKSGEVKAPKPLSRAEAGEPYQIPSSWQWVPFGATVNCHFGGGTPSKNNASYWDGEIYWASVKDVGKGKYVDETIDRITEAGLADSSSNLIPPGNLIVVTRMGLGKVSINRVPLAINQDLRALSLSSLLSIDYSYLFFKTHGFRGTGLTVKGIKVEELLNTPFPLPPLAEQHRIVAKVDELMALCDELEATQAKRESRRDRLVAGSLHRLSTPSDADVGSAPDAFRDHARFVFDNLPRLTTRPAHIKQLRQTILNLAVRGKLVAQDANDEPAAELLEKIRYEREAYAAQYKVRRVALGKCVEAGSIPFESPCGWIWTRLGELVLNSDSGWSPQTESFAREGENWGVLKVSAVSWGEFQPAQNKQLFAGVLPPKSAIVQAGDFLISRANTSELVAKSVIVHHQPKNLIMSDKIVRLNISMQCDRKYVRLVNNHALYAREYYSLNSSGTSLSMQNVTRQAIYALPVPLPPLAEQHRIVAKVDELMALCDQLESQLTANEADSRRLLEAVLHEALA